MVSTLFRSTLREIRQSLGRYIAILAIVALGVGFFAGLRMSEPNMKETGIQYLDEQEMHDIRLLSTLGFTQEDVDYFAALDGTAQAQGSVYTELLYYGAADEDDVLIAHSLTEGINEPKLTAGRMPEAGNECLADLNYFSEEDIGTTIRISDHNDEDTLELLVYDEYTIVGIVSSPLYLNYERGTASIGNGSVSAFILIPESGFDFEAYYEIYLRLDGMAATYSDTYDEQIDTITPELETLTEERAQLRYDTLYADAMDEISDGEQELADGWEEYYDGLADYEDGKQEYEDGLKDYEDGLAELEDAEQELADGWEEYEEGKADAEAELSSAKKKLDSGEADYQDGLSAYNKSKKDLDAAKAELDASETQMNDALSQLEQGKAELDGAKAQLEQGESSYAQASSLYQAGQALTGAFAPGTSVSDLLAAAERDEMLSAQLDAALQAQGSSLAQFSAGWSAAEQAMGGALTQEVLDGYARQLEQGRTEYESGLAAYEENLALYQSGRAELDAGWETYQAGADQLSSAKSQLDSARKELDAGWKDYRSGKEEAEQELEDAKQELLDGEQELADGRAELEDAKLELDDAQQELEDAETDLADAYEELLDGDQELADAYEELEKLDEPETYVLTRNENVGYVSFLNNINIVKAISVVFPVFFFLVAALVCMTTMKRMVDEQRTQIGVLKALGYSNAQVLSKYLFYSGSAAVVGCVLGYAAGSTGLPVIVWEIYKIMYSFSDGLVLTFDPTLALISFAASMLCSIGVTFVSCRMELTRPSAELIRPKSPKAGKRVFMEYITPVWKRLNFLQKVSVRNVLRYRSRLIMMLLGIGGCTALLITGFGIQDSVATIVDMQYDDITVHDFAVTFQDAQTQEDVNQYLDEHGYEAEDGLLVYSGTTDVVADTVTDSVHLIASSTDDLEGFISLHDGETAIAYPAVGEAVITQGLAEDMDISVGDTIRLRDEDLKSITVTVSAICDNYLFHYVFISPETYEQQMGTAMEFKTLYLQAHSEDDPYSESVLLADQDIVTGVTVNLSVRERVNSLLDRMDYVVVIVVVFAAALAFVVLYNLININISERVREIATIKVLGFYPKEVASYMFRETYILSVLGALIGLVMGKFLHMYVMAQIKVDGIYFPCQVLPSSYVISVGMTLLFTFIITRFMRKKLREVDMAESLKSIE